MSDIRFASRTGFDGSEFAAELANFVGAIKGEQDLISTADDGIEIMRILDAVYESAKTGHEVVLK